MSEETTTKCLECGTTSDERVLIACLDSGEQKWVCVGCLPILIHGAHPHA